MKRVIILLIFQLTVIHLFGQISYQRHPSSQRYVNTDSGLRLRNEPSFDGIMLTTIPYNGMVILYGEYSNEVIIDNIRGRWAKVFFENLIGWVFDGYLSDRNSSGVITNVTQVNLFENIKREYMLDGLLPSIPIPHEDLNTVKLEINSNSRRTETPRGFKIGDSVEMLLRTYPNITKVEIRTHLNTTYYYYFGIFFYINDWNLASMKMNFHYNGTIVNRIEIMFDLTDLTAMSPSP
jgi:hypothetical protein